MGRDHAHQMSLILDMLGTPTDEQWKNVCDVKACAYFKVRIDAHELFAPFTHSGSLLTHLRVSCPR